MAWLSNTIQSSTNSCAGMWGEWEVSNDAWQLPSSLKPWSWGWDSQPSVLHVHGVWFPHSQLPQHSRWGLVLAEITLRIGWLFTSTSISRPEGHPQPEKLWFLIYKNFAWVTVSLLASVVIKVLKRTTAINTTERPTSPAPQMRNEFGRDVQQRSTGPCGLGN